jgi:XRE family aerobic/anaerobic benzoate catabolism transcriptional regulator
MSHASQGFFRELGRRVRARRAAAGLGVADAARAAGVSRRTWTEVEAGRANPSLAVLVGLGEALGCALSELLADLGRPRRRERLALVGLRGAGKSSVGRALALALECPFVELDERIEALAGMPLSDVFALHGPEAFHRYEAEALERVLRGGERVVVATGGSIVDAPATFQRLRETCRTVWLRASPAEHFRRVLEQGDRRPMANRPRAMEELEALLERRGALYGTCDVVVDTDGHPPGAVAELVLADGRCEAAQSPLR